MERFPKPTNAGKSLEWLSGFQEEFLSNTRNAYYTNEKCSDSTGTEAKRQVDFFVKRKSDAASTTYDWKDIHVIGGHKQSQSDFRPLLYTPAQPVYAGHFLRPAHSTIHSRFLSSWYYYRTVGYWIALVRIVQANSIFIRSPKILSVLSRAMP